MSDKENSCQNCSTDPNYAIICSFFEKFAIKCGISHFNFLELQEMLENTMEVRQPLVDLHIKLLRKLRKSCSADKWERVVTRFCHSYSKQDGWELERFGYKNSRIEVKLRLLKHLLEAQFDSNPKFKSEVNKLSASDLRIEPLGRDQSGQTYWCQFDPSCNIRIYKEDVDEESWDLIAKDRVGLVNLIDELSSGEGQKELNSILNDDSNSQEIEKPITDTGQVSSGTSPPELTGDESLSQDVKQYSDSTNGSTELNVNKKEPAGDVGSDSNAVHPSESITNEPQTPKSEPSKSEPKCNLTENNPKSTVSNKPVDSVVSKPVDSTVKDLKDISVHKQSDSLTDKSSNNTFDKPSNIDNSGKKIVDKPTNSVDDKSSKNIVDKPTISIDKFSKNIIDKPTNSIDKSSKYIIDKPTSSIDDKSSKNVDKLSNIIDKSSINIVDKPSNIIDKLSKNIVDKPSNIIDKLSKNIVDKPSISIHKSSNSSIDKPSECVIIKPSNTILNKPSDSVVIATVNPVSKPNPAVKKPVDTVVLKDLQSLKEQKPSVQLSEISLKKKIVENEATYSVSKEPVTSSKEQPVSITLKKFSDGALDISKKRSVEISLVKSRVPSMDAVQDVSFKEVRQSDAVKPAGFKEIIKNNAISLQLVSKDKVSIVKAPFSDSSKHSDVSAMKLTIEPKIPEALKSVGREITLTKKTKGPPGSKLDEIFKFKRVHDPTTMTNLPPQSQPIPAYISPTVKKDSLVHMKGILGDESKELKIPIPGRASERMPSRLEERLGEISQRLGLKSKQVEIKPIRNTVVDSYQAEDLTKPKPRDQEVTEPESKKPRLNEEPKFSDPVEEPLMLVRGEGSGADCNTANPRVEFSVFQDSINDDLEQTEFSDAIEEPFMYFWGEGSGADCDTGNPELENETKETDSTTVNDEEKETDESASENNQDKKVHKLWSIDTICNKEKNDNCVGSTNDQFFFGPGCLKDIDKSGTSSPSSDGSKNNNSLDKTNCDNKSTDKNSIPVKEVASVKESEELNLNNKDPNKNCTNNSENSVGKNDKSDMADANKSNSIPKAVNQEATDDVASDEVGKEEDKTDISNQNDKSVSDKALNDAVTSSNVMKPESKEVTPNNKLTKSQAEKVNSSEKSNDGVENDKIISDDCSPEKTIDKAEPSDKSNGISDSKEDTKEAEQEKTDSKISVKENFQTIEECKKEVKPDVKDEDIEQNEQSDKLESDPVKEEIKEECNDKSDSVVNEDKTEPKENSEGDAIDKSEVNEVGAKSDEDDKEETDKNVSYKSKSKAKKNNKKRVRRSSGSGVSRPRPDPVLEPKGSQGEAEILEYRRPRRSAALIATQLSESIIKAKVKKPPTPKKEEKKEENNKDKAKEIEPEIKPVKKQPAKAKAKKPPPKSKKKSNAEVNDSVKKPDQQDENGAKDKDQETETNENKDDEASKGGGLNSFSFDVDASGNIPVQAALTALSRKRRLNSSGKDNSEDEENDEEEDEDEPLAMKKQKLRAKLTNKKKSAKGGKQNKKMKVNEEAESSSDEENEDNGTQKATKKKPPAKNQLPSQTKDDAGKPKPKRGSLNLLGLTPLDLISVGNVEVSEATGRSIRTSRRIAQIKIKEQEEERKLVEESLMDLKEKKKPSSKKKKSGEKDEKKPSKKKSSAKLSDGDFTPYDQDSNDTLKKKKGKGLKKKKKALNFDTNNPWKSSSGSGTSEEDNDELEHYDIEEEEEEDLRAKKLESDHEFSPESDLEKDDDEGIPVRHARTALKGEAKVEEEDDTSCQKCSKTDHPEWILLCDKCDKGWHGSCLRPALMIVPEGDWFCPPCQHLSLVEKLKETLRLFERDSKRRENDELRRKRLAYVGISLSNLLPPPGTKVRLDDSSSSGSEGSDRSGSRSGSQSRSSSGSSSYEDEPVYQLRVRSKTNQSYRFNDYDQLINSAIQEDLDDTGVAGNHGRGKDIGNIIEAEKDETNGVHEKDDDEEGGEGWKPRVVPRKLSHHSKKKSRKLTAIDDVSSEDDKDSDEDFKGSSSSSSSEYSGSGSSSGRAPVRRSTRARTSRVDKDFINDNSDDSEAPRKKKSRKVWTESETESDETWGQKKKAKGKARNQRRKKSRYSDDSESDRPRKSKSKKSKVRYGLSEDEDYGRKTRGTRKKVNYQESDSDEQIQVPETETKVTIKTRRVIDSDDEDDYKPEPLDERKRAILSDSEDEMSDEDEDLEKEESVKEEAEVEEKVEEKQKDSVPDSNSAPVIEDKKPPVEEPVSPSVSDDKSQDSEPPEPKRPTIYDNKESDVEMFMGDVEEEDEEELEEEEEDEDEDEDGLKIDIPPVRNAVEPKQPTLPPISVKPTVSLQLQSVKDKMVQEELNDELCSVPGPPKVVPVPVPASEIKEKELDKTEDKVEEKKPVEPQPKVNSIRIVPQHKLMANPPPQLEIKPMLMRPRVPVPPGHPPPPGGMPGPYPGMRYPARPGVNIMRHGAQYPHGGPDQGKYFAPQFPPYYPQQHHFPSEDFPAGGGPPGGGFGPPMHPGSSVYAGQGGGEEGGEFGGLVSYFSSQHEDNLDS